MATVPTSGETVQQNSDYTRAPESLDRKPAMAPSMLEVQEPQFDPVAGLEPDPVDSVRATQALAAGRSQDQAVQYYDVSKRSGIPVDFVANNFEEISKQVDQPDYNLKTFAQKSPNLAKWMAKNPNNFALIKPDIPNEEKFQNIVDEYGWGNKFRDDLIQGFSTAALGATRFPGLMTEMRATPINLGAKFLDSDFRVTAPDIMKDNSVIQFLDTARNEAVKRNPYADGEILSRWGRGDYEGAAKAATSIIAANIPNLLMAAAGPVGLAVIGANVAANKSAELQKEGVDVATAVPNALATGVVEAATEKLGTAGIIKRWETEIVKKYGQQAFKELMKSVAKNIGAAMVTEGTEEVAADVGEAFIDWSTGVNPKAFDELSASSLANTFLGGALAGGAYGPLSTAPLAINSHRAKLWSDNVVNTITNMGKNMESSKLLQANPQAWREKATAQLEGSANENIFIPVEQFEVLFQSEEGGVNKAVIDLDAVDSYNHAKETGGNVKIKTADFLAVAQPSGILPRAAMDITFDPEKPTSRQAQDEAEENKKIIAEMQSMEKEGVNINAEFDPIALEAMDISEPKNGKSVEQQVFEKLVATGMPAQKARANSVVYRMFQVQAKRMKNVTAQDLFARYGLNIGRARSEQAPGITREQATAMPAPTLRETFLPSLQRLQKGLIEPTPKGDTLFQFIRKLGGINKYSDTSSYKGELNRDLPKSIFRKDGLDLDTVFLRMQEAGYPVETIQDAFDLIEKEASGSPVYTVSQESDSELDNERILYNEDLRLLNALNRNGFDFNKLQSEITALESKRSSLREQKLTTANEQELKKINKQIAKLKLEQDKMNEEIIQRIEGGLLDQEAPSGDVFLQMAGQLAETANKRELSKAEKMRKDGVDMETIRKETGWHLGRDKRWRFEISDDQAEFLPIRLSSGVTNLKLSEVLKHDKLFQAYPKLKDVNVVIKHQRANALVNGTWARGINTITLNVPSTVKENPKKEKINERLAEIRRMDEFQNVFNASGVTRAEIDNFLKTPLGEEYRNLTNASRLLKDERSKAKELSPKVMSTLLHEIQHAIQSTEGFQRGSSSGSTKRYLNTLGEIEARDASDRQNLTDEQRKELPPSAQNWPSSAPKEYKSYATAPYIDWNTIRTELPIEEIPEEIVPPEVLEQFKIGEQMTFWQKSKTTYRGRFFKADDTFNIDLLEGENSSTFLHETGHFFMHVMMDLAEDPMSSYEIKSDVQKIFEFLGVESRDQIGRDQHEKFAEAWEKYFMEGKAPAVSLESAFETFKGWMMAVYKFIRNMYPDVKMTDEIRGVFDRMLATEAEIAEARAAQSMAPMILETRGIMPDSEAAIYNKLVEDEDKAAKDNLRGQAMLNISKKVRAQREAARDRITKQVTDQVNAEPDQVVYKMIKDGMKPDGTQIPGSLKMSRAMAAKLVNKETLEKLPSGLFSKDGQHPNTTAEMLGGELDGVGLLLQMANMEPAKQKIDRLIKEEMESEFPDPTQSPNFREEAIAALHNESGSERRMFELRYLINNAPASAKKMIQRIAGRRYASIDPYRTRAKIIVGQTKVSELRPSQYKRLEIKYANEAMKSFLKGDWEAAVEAKAKEITNYELYKLAHEARIEVNAQMVRFRRAFKPDEQIAKTRDMDTVMAIRGMLGRVGIGNIKEDKIASYLEKMASYDNDKDQIKVIEQLINTANVDSDSIWDATFNEFVKVKSSFNSLWEMAKELNRMDVLEGKAQKADAITELRSQIDKFKGTKAIEEFSGSATALEKFSNGLLSFVAANRRIESWVDLMDGGNVNGPFRTYFWQPIQSAYENFIIRKRDVTKQIETLLTEYKDIFKEGAIQTTLVGLPDKNNQVGSKYIFKNKAELLGAMIHIGNDSNKMKLLVGNGWGSVDENGVIDSSEWDRNIDRMQKNGTLTVRDYEFLQKYWDIMEGIKPDAQRAHKKLYGYYFDEISAKEIVTPFGVFKGGYAPAVRDMERVKDITREKEQLENGTSGANMFPSSADGFTISRNPNAAQPLKMDLNLIVNHTDQVLRFSYMTPAMKDVSKLIFDRSFRNDLDSLSYKFVEKAIIPWLDRSVKQSVSTPSTYKEIDYVAKKLRANVGAGTMFLNVINTLQQFTGVIVASSKVKPKYLAHAIGQFVRTPKEMSVMIHAKSKQMEIRASKQMDDSLDGINDILVNPSIFDDVQKWGKKHAYVLQAMAQNTVDAVVWSGAYNQSVADGLSEADAVRAADAAVRLTQGSMAAQDIAKFEAGTPAMRMFTMFGGYFNMLANLLGSEFGKVMKTETGIKNRAMKMLPLYLQIITLPAALSLAIVRLGAGQGLADDDDELYETLLQYFGFESVRTMAAATPLVGQVANMMMGKFTEQPMDDRLSLSPVIKAIESAGSVPFDIYKGASNAEINKGAVKDSLSLITLLTGIPAAQVAGKPIGYLMDVESGKANPENELDFARGLVTGRTPR